MAFPAAPTCREAAGRPSSALPRAPVETNCCDRHTPPSLSAEAGPRHLPGRRTGAFRQVSGGGDRTRSRAGGRLQGIASSLSGAAPLSAQLPVGAFWSLPPSVLSRGQGASEMRCRTAQGVCARSCFAQPAPDLHLLTGMTLRACECRVAQADVPEMACKKALPAKVKGGR